MGYPALLWLSTAASLLGSVQFGEHTMPPRLPTAARRSSRRALPPPECPSMGCSSHRPSPAPPPLPGYHLGVLNTCEAHVEVDIGSGEAGASLVSLLLIGAALGSLVAGRLADRLGPR